MKEATKLPELPRLPKGQGTLIYTHGNKILRLYPWMAAISAWL